MRAWDRRSRRIAAKTAQRAAILHFEPRAIRSRHNQETGFRFQTAGRVPANRGSVMLIRVLFVALVAFPLAVALTIVTAFAGDQSAKDQVKLQNAGSAFNRALERPAAQRDLSDNLSNQDKVRSFRTKLN
jgi:hypothetical protein